MMIGVTSRFATIEISMVAAASAPNCATTVKLENSRIPKPKASATDEMTRGVASSATA